MDGQDELAAREADLAERERRAARHGADPEVFARLATERDATAQQRDDDADARDLEAAERRQRAADRDVQASARDRRARQAHDDADPGFANRFLSARDVDASAADRADALDDERAARQDRRRAREDREHAADDRARAAAAAGQARVDAADLQGQLRDRAVVGQAQGLLMARLGIGPDEALALLRGASDGVDLGVVAWALVQDATPGSPAGTGGDRRAEAADERERSADQREADADDRELRLDQRESGLQELLAHLTDRQRRADERADLEAVLERSTQAIARSRARLAREEAADRRRAPQDDLGPEQPGRRVERPQVAPRDLG